MERYFRKEYDKIKKWLFKGKVILLIGARQVGKTTLLRYLMDQNKDMNKSNTIWLNADLPEVRQRFEKPTLATIKNTIGSYKIVIIDEIQRIKNAGLLLKIMIDNFPEVQFIATGSSSLEISETIFEPLTGRHILFNLYPLSLAEMYDGKSPFEIEQEFPFHLVYGNYPEICVKRTLAQPLLENLTEQYLYKDVLVWKDIRKPELLDKLLKLLAYQMGSEVNIYELSKSLKVQSETVESYIDLLEKSFVVYRLKAYSTNERKEVSKMSKVYFWDNGIRNTIIGNFNTLENRDDTGALWENFITSERLKRNAWANHKVKSHFWRNYNQSEVDYIELKQGQLDAFEMKWNTTKNHKVTRAFTNAYPDATTEVITPINFVEFCGL